MNTIGKMLRVLGLHSWSVWKSIGKKWRYRECTREQCGTKDWQPN
jgi:hypothetical protein